MGFDGMAYEARFKACSKGVAGETLLGFTMWQHCSEGRSPYLVSSTQYARRSRKSNEIKKKRGKGRVSLKTQNNEKARRETRGLGGNVVSSYSNCFGSGRISSNHFGACYFVFSLRPYFFPLQFGFHQLFFFSFRRGNRVKWF